MKEVEVRYKIDEIQIEKIRKNSELVTETKEYIDLVFGYDGFNSLANRGYITRIRKKPNSIHLECKRRVDEISWNEEKIELESIKQGYNFLTNMKMQPYLCIKRTREKRKIKGATIEIDFVDLLGTYVEIESDGTIEFEKVIEKFVKENGIEDKREPLYGDIFKEKIETDNDFKNKFNKMLEDLIKR